MLIERETVLAAGLLKAQVQDALRKALGRHLGEDVEASLLSGDGAGTAETTSARVQWVTAGGGELFALQWLDLVDGRAWEFCAAQMPDERFALSRRLLRQPVPQSDLSGSDLMDELWGTLLGDSPSWDVHTPQVAPSFMTLAAAALSSGDLRVINDQSQQVADLRDEVDYWRNLSRSQARLLKERSALASGFYATAVDDAGNQPQVGNVVDTSSLKNLEQWAAIHSDRILILPRAISAAKRSPYENPPLVYECLELLAHEYRLTKLGQLDRNAFKDKCVAMGLDFGGSVDPSRAGAQGEEYFFRWGGRRLHLDQHLGKSTARDPRFILRIYYTWSEDDGKPIVGWLPSHLGNSKS